MGYELGQAVVLGALLSWVRPMVDSSMVRCCKLPDGTERQIMACAAVLSTPVDRNTIE
jgi:hypothetical protein